MTMTLGATVKAAVMRMAVSRRRRQVALAVTATLTHSRGVAVMAVKRGVRMPSMLQPGEDSSVAAPRIPSLQEGSGPEGQMGDPAGVVVMSLSQKRRKHSRVLMALMRAVMGSSQKERGRRTRGRSMAAQRPGSQQQRAAC
jgi:hypothetical protein